MLKKISVTVENNIEQLEMQISKLSKELDDLKAQCKIFNGSGKNLLTEIERLKIKKSLQDVNIKKLEEH